MFIELKTKKGYRLVNVDLFSNIYSEPSYELSKEGEVMVFFQFIDRKKEGLFSITTQEDFDRFRKDLRNYYDRITQ